MFDPCGRAGGSAHPRPGHGEFTDTKYAKFGDLGSKGLPKYPTGAVWEAGSIVETMASLMAKAQSDARALLTRDPELTTERGRAVRTLLWLMEQEKAIRLISVG